MCFKKQRFIGFILLCLFLGGSDLFAQNLKYWVKLSDKDFNSFSLEKPEEYLSQRALDRRNKQGISIDSTDIPVSLVYIDSIAKMGVQIICTSKWLNGLTIEVSDTAPINAIKNLGFVDTVLLSWVDNSTKAAKLKLESATQKLKVAEPLGYGPSYTQIAIHNGQKMHEKGFTGEGKLIAILDAGFNNANIVSSLSHLFANGQILGTRDFVNPFGDVYKEHEHGMEVLTTIGAFTPNILIGTAYDASFYLIRTEDDRTEQPVELDYWVAGAEFADSIGADLINSSLGYYFWDEPFTDNIYDDMDGKTMRASIGAAIAAKKGMIITSSAGNEGNNAFGRIISPSDADGVVCVGSVDKDSTYTSFSSRGFAADGRIKPNLMANGRDAIVQVPDGNFAYINGTSFSSPIMCGLLAILWQALPDYTAQEIIALAEKSAHLYTNPTISFGYGIPNILEAYSFATSEPDINSEEIKIYPNPFKNDFKLLLQKKENADLTLYSLSGQVIYTETDVPYERVHTVTIQDLPKAVYILKLQYKNEAHKQLIIKQ